MQRLEVSGAVRHIYASLGFKGRSYRPSFPSRNQGYLFPAVRNSHIKHCNISDPLTFPRAIFIVPKANLTFIIIVKPKFSKDFQSSAT